MNCMKCGREIALGQVFCKECLADMADYPVKPGTPVILPNYEPKPVLRRPARKSRKPEEQLSFVRNIATVLALLLIAVSLTFGFITSALLNKLDEKAEAPTSGQNYSTEAPDMTTD